MSEELKKGRSWFEKNVQTIFQFIRYGLALFIVVFVLSPLYDSEKSLLEMKVKEIITPIETTKTTVLTSTVNPKAVLCGKSNNPDKNVKQRCQEEHKVGAATQQVWVYGLQLAAWVGMLGISLWSILALIRFE